MRRGERPGCVRPVDNSHFGRCEICDLPWFAPRLELGGGDAINQDGRAYAMGPDRLGAPAHLRHSRLNGRRIAYSGIPCTLAAIKARTVCTATADCGSKPMHQPCSSSPWASDATRSALRFAALSSFFFCFSSIRARAALSRSRRSLR